MQKIECGAPSRLTLMALDDRKIIGYRPRLNTITGSVTGTVLLCQVMYWAQHAGNPFWKFMQPCDHRSYRPGDSWTEELGFTRTEFETALKRIGQKVSRKTVEYDREAYVWYWTDMGRITWYQVNWEKVNNAFDAAYSNVMQESCNTYCGKAEIHNAGKPQHVMQESGFTYKEQRLTSENNQIISSSGGVEESRGSDAERDDDDLFKDLLDLGLSPTLAREVLGKNERVLVQEKLKDMLMALKSGKVKNMTGYALKVFSQELYSPAQADKIITKSKIVKEEKEKKELYSGLRRNDGGISGDGWMDVDIPAPVFSPERVREWEKHIYGNKVLWSMYQKRGTESPLIRVSMKQYLEDKHE